MSDGCLAAYDSATIGCWERSCFAGTPQQLSGLLGSLKTGDLFLAAASPAGRTAGLNTIPTCRWDHVGLVWVHEGVPYVIDSGSARYYASLCRRPLDFGTGSAAGDGDGGAWTRQQSGPQMYDLAKFIEAQGQAPLTVKEGAAPWYYERLGIRSLAEPLTEPQLAALRSAIELYRDRPYQKSGGAAAGEMLRAALDIFECAGVLANRVERRESLFCSELVAALLMDARLLPSSPPANEYVPSDFARDRGCNLSALLGGCWVSWALGRCGVGNLRNAQTGAPLLGREVVLSSLHPKPPPGAPAARSPPPRGAGAAVAPDCVERR